MPLALKMFLSLIVHRKLSLPPNQHLKVKDELLQFPILTNHWFQNFLNVNIVSPVLLQHDHLQYSLINFLSHLLSNLRFLFFKAFIKRFDGVVYRAGLAM